MDAAAIAAETGWAVHHEVETASTNDLAARLVAAGVAGRTAIVADCQTAGRGRGGRIFASPEGGLYVSLILDARARDLPARTVALVALAAAEAIEELVERPVAIKWPNDLWIDRRKVGGILLEMTRPQEPVVAGLGINLRAVPQGLPPEVRRGTGALEPIAGGTVSRSALLLALLRAVDRLQARGLEPAGAESNERAWRGRLALVGEEVACRFAGAEIRGVLEDVSLLDGLLIRDAVSGPVWRQAEHVQDLRPSARTIP